MKKTLIEWTNYSWNPVRGCSRVSEGCRNCYAERQALRFAGSGGAYEGLVIKTSQGAKWTGRIDLVPSKLSEPLRLKDPRRIFVNSMGDLFHPYVPVQFIADVFAYMAVGYWHQYQVLTKHAGRMKEVLASNAFHGLFEQALALALDEAEAIVGRRKGMEDLRAWAGDALPLPNVWLGVSVENQEAADERVPLLLQTPAAVRWLSMEPLLGPVDISKWLDPWTCTDCCHHGSEATSGPCLCDDCGVEAVYDQTIGSGQCPTCRKDDGTSDSVGSSCPECSSVRGWSRDYGFKFDSERPALLDWVVVGGESGQKARPMHPDCPRALRDQCAAADVPFLYKQHGEWVEAKREGDTIVVAGHAPFKNKPEFYTFADGTVVARIGKKAAGRLLDGRTWDQYPDGRGRGL